MCMTKFNEAHFSCSCLFSSCTSSPRVNSALLDYQHTGRLNCLIISGKSHRWPLPSIVLQMVGAFRPACGHSRGVFALQNHPRSNIQVSEDMAHRKECIAQCFQPHMRCCSSFQLNINAKARDSNASVNTLNQKTTSLARTARIPYSLPSSIYGSTWDQHAAFTSKSLIRDPSATFAPHDTNSCCPSHRPTGTS